MKTFVVGDVHGRAAQLHCLLDMLPREEAADTLVFLGDLIDRGPDAPGCVELVMKLQKENPERVLCLRGNHEQMLLDFIEGSANLWITPVTGGERTFEQYTGKRLNITREQDLDDARREIESSVPSEHLDFFHELPYFHEDDYAIYVHAGLDRAKHPKDTAPQSLALDARHGVLQKLSRQALHLWSHANAVAALARPGRSSRNLYFSQRHRYRYRL